MEILLYGVLDEIRKCGMKCLHEKLKLFLLYVHDDIVLLLYDSMIDDSGSLIHGAQMMQINARVDSMYLTEL